MGSRRSWWRTSDGAVSTLPAPRPPHPHPRAARHQAPAQPALTCVIPAYNEAETIQDTVWSVLSAHDRPEVVIVVDDGSTDHTGQLAAAAGTTVVRTPENTGSKEGPRPSPSDSSIPR